LGRTTPIDIPDNVGRRRAYQTRVAVLVVALLVTAFSLALQGATEQQADAQEYYRTR
jgi:hypothetical protein